MEQDPFKLFPSLLVGIALEVKSNSKKSDYDKINSSTSTSHLSVDDQVKAQDIFSFYCCTSVRLWGKTKAKAVWYPSRKQGCCFNKETLKSTDNIAFL
jgi:hypothetical protein